MESIWEQNGAIPPRSRLSGDIGTDVAVVGAGMAGILIASMLHKDGLRVVVLEADRIGSGQTCGTTAKVTSQHGLLYSELIQSQGEAKARQYAQANQQAVQAYRARIAAEHIDCDWQERRSFVYGGDEALLRAEARAAARLGLPASYVACPPLPVPAAGAVQFEEQAQFHPLKFLRAASDGLTVFEHTLVLGAKEDSLCTPYGTVRARHIVWACHCPFVNFPGFYFARMHQERSYVLALRNAALPDGMYLGAEDGFSFRGQGELLLLGGGGHRTGKSAADGGYALLRQKAAAWFPGCREEAHWSAQDGVTPDRIPYIGRYSPARPNWYVAAGFQKWGMTTSMVCALLLRQLICGRESPNAAVFSPARHSAKLAAGLAAEGGQSAIGLLKYAFQPPAGPADEIPPGHGGIIRLNGKKTGVYKDEAGKLYPVNIRCPHLGCQLEWNPEERSWDCPCHGSRFDRFGRPLSGPAQKGIFHEKS